MSVVLGDPIYGDPSPLRAPVVSAGSWLAALPASNVQDRRLSRVARSTDATAASTKLRWDLGSAQPVGLLAVLITNLTKTSTPTVQWKGGTSAGASDVYNPGTQQAWPTGLTLDDVTGPDGTQEHIWSVLIPTAAQTARHWELSIVDTANADGYLDVARAFPAGAYRPSRPPTAGARSLLENGTERTDTDGGATLFKVRPTRRVSAFSLANIPESEALTTIRRMQHRLGTSGPLFFVFDETDPYRYERSYQGTLRQLGALEYPDSLLYNTIGFEIAEDI